MRATSFTGAMAALAAAASLPSAAFADAKRPDGRDIMDKAYRVQRVEMAAKIKVIIADDRGRRRERKLEVLEKKHDGLWRTYQKFVFPPDIAGTQLLVIEHEGLEANDQVLYEPIGKRTRRVNPVQRSGRFVGTDFFYEDLDVHHVDEDVHALARSEILKLKVGEKSQQIDCWVVESTPKPSKVTSYDKVVSWVQKSSFYTRQSEMYRQDKPVKRFRVFGLKKDEGQWIPILSRMDDLESGSSTILQTQEYDLDASKIPDEVFTESYLLSGG